MYSTYTSLPLPNTHRHVKSSLCTHIFLFFQRSTERPGKRGCRCETLFSRFLFYEIHPVVNVYHVTSTYYLFIFQTCLSNIEIQFKGFHTVLTLIFFLFSFVFIIFLQPRTLKRSQKKFQQRKVIDTNFSSKILQTFSIYIVCSSIICFNYFFLHICIDLSKINL